MKFTRYADTAAFAADTLELLLQDEAQNCLPISFIGDKEADASGWLLASVKDEGGSVVLTAACTPPHNIVLYETGNKPSGGAVGLLSAELNGMGFALPGVMAESSLALRFAEAHAGKGGYRSHMSMNIMRLEDVSPIEPAPGHCRALREEDLFFAPYWELAFNADCQLNEGGLRDKINQVWARIGRDSQYIWEDGHPVSQAYRSKKTPNGAVVSGVYTPPHYRGRGYATSVTAALSRELLERGNKFCALFADAKNPISCGIYRKIGYRDVCLMEELWFNE